MKVPIVYIMTNKKHETLYTGVTQDIVRRIYEHKNGSTQGFTVKYGCKLLVFYEMHETMEFAITREKQIKAGSRKKKIRLIEAMNPKWEDLHKIIM